MANPQYEELKQFLKHRLREDFIKAFNGNPRNGTSQNLGDALATFDRMYEKEWSTVTKASQEEATNELDMLAPPGSQQRADIIRHLYKTSV